MKQIAIAPNRLFTLQEAADLTGVGYDNMWRWIQRGHLRTTRFGRAYVIAGNDLLTTLAKWQRKEIELDMPRHGSVNELVAV